MVYAIRHTMKTNQRSIIVRASGVALYVRLPLTFVGQAFAGQAFGDRPDILTPPM